MESRLCLSGTPPLYPGSPLQLPDGPWIQSSFVASPLFANLDNNPSGKEELIVPAAGGKLIAYKTDANGSPVVYRVYDTGSAANTQANIKATPVIVDLPNGHKGIFAALYGDEMHANPANEDSRVFGWDAVTGQLLPGWPVDSGRNAQNQGKAGTDSPLASGDLDGDGVPEIIVTAFSHFVTAYHLDGSIMWRYNNDDTVESGAVVGDIDRDGKNEVVFTGPVSGGISSPGGLMTILSWNGEMRSRTYIGDVFYSAPVLADLNNDGYLEIIAPGGSFFDRYDQSVGNTAGAAAARAAGNRVYAFDFLGHILWSYATTNNDSLSAPAHQTYGTPAVADINGDGRLDIIDLDQQGYVHVIGPDGRALPGWEGGRFVPPPDMTQQAAFGGAIVADVDGDGSPDIIAEDGVFLTAFDRNGNVIFRYFTANAENLLSAAAVGQFDGRGGLEMASLSLVSAGNPNRPDLVTVFQLPQSTAEAPWPLQRRSASAGAVAQALPYAATYVVNVYRTLTGADPVPSDGIAAAFAIQRDQVSLARAAQAVAGTDAAHGHTVDVLFRQYLGRTPSPQERANWAYQLRSINPSDLALNLASSAEFVRQARSVEDLVGRLFQASLGRAPSAAEVSGWSAQLRNGTSLRTVASLLINSREALTYNLRTFYAQAFGTMAVPADAIAAAAWDLHHGARAESIYAGILSTNGNYASTELLASWARSIYRDVLSRDASPDEVANVVNLLDAGQASPQAIVGFLVNSAVGRAQYIREQFNRLLGRQPTNDQINALIGYSSREALQVFLTTTTEYLQRNGGTISGLVTAMYRDLGDIYPVGQSDLNSWVSRINNGTPAATLAQALTSGDTYRNMVVVDDLFRYVPSESMGFLRIGTLDASTPGQPINPDPALVSYYINQLRSGAGTDGLVVQILTSPDYFNRSSYYKGIFRSRAIRT